MSWPWRIGVAFTGAGMALGAFGAHGLKKRPGFDPGKIHSWETAAHYAIYNGLGLMIVSRHPRFALHPFAAPAIALGGFVFSSSIFLILLTGEKFKKYAPLTPIGGSIMIAGYLSLLF